jgi:nitroreductase
MTRNPCREPPMSHLTVSAAVAARYSCRAFRPDPVDEALLRDIIARAMRAPSGGNLQPWHVDVLTGEALARFLARVAAQAAANARGEGTEYDVYPKPVPDPWETRRFAVGEDLYASIGVARADRAARWAQFMKNYRFFGAPVGLFVSIDRRMGPPQWSDLGMMMQTLTLLAVERGLATCAQEAWAVWPKTIADFLGWPRERMLFSGMAIGYADEEAPINRWRSARADFDECVRFHG